MIDKQSLTAEWLASKKAHYTRADPSIMERVVFALYLLEQLVLSDLNFVFKGGTSLLLLLNEAKRFSIDIDIVISPNITQSAIEQHLSKVVADGTFSHFELDTRRSFQSDIPKAHYRFIYQSVIAAKQQEILLDILFEETPYPVLIQKPIDTEWIQQQGNAILVNLPDVNAIAGDKLTAFAPNTIGIPYGLQKEREIIKQLFDIGCLFDVIDNTQTLKASFQALAEIEIAYRKIPINTDEVLEDIIQTGLVLAHREKQPNAADTSKFKELSIGISQFNYFLFSGSFRIEEAQTASAKAAYLSAIIKTNYEGELHRFDPLMPLSSYLIQHPDFNFLNRKLKHVPNGALFYWYQTLHLLSKA